MDEQKIDEFIDFASKLQGYEKGEAQIFLDRLFVAYGNKGAIEAGAGYEKQIIVDTKTKFCDLLWPNIVLFEMKKRGSKLAEHFQQAKTYWDNTYGDRPKYVVLCNFDEFWIYNWNIQKDPLDIVPLKQLRERWKSLAFLAPEDIKPIFGNNLVEVTEGAADRIAQLYNSLVRRGIDRVKARRYSLQCLVCLFAEDSGLLPDSTMFTSLINDCLNGQSTYDLFHGLFTQMNSKEMASGGKFKGVKYFNGGIFSQVFPLELTRDELLILQDAAKFNWSKVQPSIFGTIFEDSLDKEERHQIGAHYTLLSEIMSVVEPTILRPWRERIESARTLKELESIHEALGRFKVLDPACGSGNFLYIAYRELKSLELQLLSRMSTEFSVQPTMIHPKIKCNQFYGIDVNPLGIELAKVTLSMAKKAAAEEFNRFKRVNPLFDVEDALPFDNLDNNFIQGDALFEDWPKVDAIIGNPPYQSKNKMQEEFTPEYLSKLRNAYPQMPGMVDYCVYWFRKAHDMLPMEGRAGLVGTNTIRQTYSRMGGLDYIVSNDGVITEAISTMPWGGEAVVHVSIVNWIKTKNPVKGPKKLREKLGENRSEPWVEEDLPVIPSSLSFNFDVTKAVALKSNSNVDICFQGQTHGNEGFLLSMDEAEKIVKADPANRDVLYPFLIADELIGIVGSKPRRFVIDFGQRDIFEAKKFSMPFQIVESKVLPDRKEAFKKERDRNATLFAENPKAKVNHHHENFMKKWWHLSYPRENLINKISTMDRYIACGRVTKRPIFEFVSTRIRPNDSLVVFALEDDYSFGILQSKYHWNWFIERCSTLKDDPRYTSNTVFDSFPWPQWGIVEKYSNPDDPKNFSKCVKIAQNIANAGRELRGVRNKLATDNNWSLREIYRVMELPGDNPLRDAHNKLDQAVRDAYLFGLPKSMKGYKDLELLFILNQKCSELEKSSKNIFGPGLPKFCQGHDGFRSSDCIQMKEPMEGAAEPPGPSSTTTPAAPSGSRTATSSSTS